MESSDDAQIVKDLSKLVLVSGKLSDIHEKNMKMYPLIYFDGVKEVKIEYDLSYEANVFADKENNLTIKAPLRDNYVTYSITLHPGAVNNNMDKRFAALEASIKTLFWKDLMIEVIIDGKPVYKSKK